MFFELKNWKNKTNTREFSKEKKKVLEFTNQNIGNENLKDFYFLHETSKLLNKEISRVVKLFPEFEDIVLVGTGGSSLGSKALLMASCNSRITFLENIDPIYVIERLKKLKKKKNITYYY